MQKSCPTSRLLRVPWTLQEIKDQRNLMIFFFLNLALCFNQTSKKCLKFVPTFKLIENGPVDVIVMHQIG